MPKKKPVTTRRGQHHVFKSFRINLVKDATLEKIDSNRLRNNPDLFEKKKVTFEKKNSDPSHFRETLCNAFPSLHGKEFSLWRLACTNASKETKTSLIPLPSEIDNAVALCNCEELNRSCLYIKLQAAPASRSFSSPQPHSAPSTDEDDSHDSMSSTSPPASPSNMSTVPDLLPTNSYLFGSLPVSLNPAIHPTSTTHESPILTFVQTTQENNEHHIQPLASQPWLTVATSDISQSLLVPQNSSVPLNEQPFTLPYCIEKENELLDMTSKVQVPSGRDTENRHPKKRRFPPDNEKNCEPTAYTDAAGSMTDDMDHIEELRNQTKTVPRILGFLPNAERAASSDIGSQQLTTTSYTKLLSDDTLTPETAQQARTVDNSYSHQTSLPTFYLNPSVFLDLQNNASEAPCLQGISGQSNSFGQPLSTNSLSSVINYASGTLGLQASAQQWSDVNSTSANAPIFSWQQDGHFQRNHSLRTDLNDVIVTRSDYLTQDEWQISLLRTHMDFLVDRIDPDFGLLDVMIARKDLTVAEFHQIRSIPSTVEERNHKLLNYIIDKNKADKLIAALEEARQIHVANYLNSNGEHKEEYLDTWPMSNNELEKLTVNRQALIDGLDASYLSYKLHFKGVINKRQHEFILSKPTNSEKNEAMLEILRHGSTKHYKQIIESLRELNHDRILRVLDEAEDDKFVSSSVDRDKIQFFKQQLEELTRQLEHERKEKEQLFCQMQDNPGLLPITGAAALCDVGGEQPTASSHTEPLSVNTLTSEMVQQKRSVDISYSQQSSYPNPSVSVDLQNNGHEASNKFPYKLVPDLVQTIRTKAAEEKNSGITGLTILDKELFVVSEESSEVEVYDLVKFSFSRQWNLKELFSPHDIGSCNRNKFLYILNCKELQNQVDEILRVDANGKLIRKWSTGDWGWSLSVTYESNVILTFHTNNKLNEYSSDGELIREINLSSDAGICHPSHAIKLTSGHFLISHGYSGGDLHRVCIVDANGKLKKAFGGTRGSTIGKMNRPFYLAVDGQGFVMVGDQGNHRVLLLDSNLEFQRKILSKEKHALLRPMGIFLDQENRRLFVAQNEDGNERILIISV